MLKYVLKRLAGGIPIIIGVMLVTFVLCNCGAGDPAALMLGKNASPQELESLRTELKLDRPLFFGHWRRTERFRTHNFSTGAGDWAALPGLELPGSGKAQVWVHLKPGTTVEFKSNWSPAPGARQRLAVQSRGELTINGLPAGGGHWKNHRLELDPAKPLLVFAAGPGGADVRRYQAEVWQANVFDSQFIAALRELVDFRRDPGSGNWSLSFFNFGKTLLTGEPIRKVLWEGLGPTLAIALPVFVIELVMAILIALISAYWRDSWADRSLVLASVAGMSVSYLVFIILGQYVLAYRWNWFPVWGYESWHHLVLPVAVGVLSSLGGSVRFYRTVFLNEMYRDHIRTALAKGCGPWRILLRHVLPNAMIPVITRIAVVLPFLYTGSLLLESFFGIPGLGYAGINALANADLQLLKALVIIGALLFVVANILADIGNALADPRVRLK